MSIGQVMIHVSSLPKAKEFYVEILNLKIKQDLSDELNMIILENEGCYFTLHGGYQQNTPSANDCKSVVILKVNNIEKTREDLLAKGIELHGDIVESPVHHYQALRDFDGNWIEVAQFK